MCIGLYTETAVQGIDQAFGRHVGKNATAGAHVVKTADIQIPDAAEMPGVVILRPAEAKPSMYGNGIKKVLQIVFVIGNGLFEGVRIVIRQGV
jgi:hypothetical protein